MKNGEVRMIGFDDRRRGCLLGLAVGDALGAAVEFARPGTFEPVTAYRAGGPLGLGPGEWTDDTSMALALADSLADAGFDPADQARRYVRWWRHGDYSGNGRCFDIGNTPPGGPLPVRADELSRLPRLRTSCAAELNAQAGACIPPGRPLRRAFPDSSKKSLREQRFRLWRRPPTDRQI